MKRTTVFAAATAAILLTASARGQTLSGTQQGGFTNPDGNWNHHPVGFMDYSTGVFRVYWSCGNPDGICAGHSTGISYYDGQPVSINSFSAVCDIQDPSVVKFNGTYYLFAGGIAAGSPGCPNAGNHDNEHAAIYAFSSSDGLSFSPLSNNPVIKVAADPSCYTCYFGHGIGFPSAVVMGSGSFIRLYFHRSSPGYGLTDDGIEAMDTYDGQNFFNERYIGNGWAPSVKRVGLNGDYPMVMSYNTGAGPMVATSSSWDDTVWTVGNGGLPISTSPTAGYAPGLESEETGLYLNANGAHFTSPVSGQVNFMWNNNVSPGSRIYRGQGNAAQFFTF